MATQPLSAQPRLPMPSGLTPEQQLEWLRKVKQMRDLRRQRDEQLAQEQGWEYRRSSSSYFDDPVAWTQDCIAWPAGKHLAPYQEEILAGLVEHKRAAVRGCHGLGKTAVASLGVLWFATTRDGAGADWKIPTTASVGRQLTEYLWPEIHKWARLIRWDKLGRGPFNERTELLMLHLKLRYGSAFALASSDDPTALEGAHGDELLYLFDEAKAIPDGVWDAAEGAFSTAGDAGTNAYALAISTPGEPIGRFYDIHARRPGTQDWWVRHVTLAEAIKAGRVTEEWAENRKALWGEGSAVYQNRVLGEFASASEDSVIPLSWVEQANDRWRARYESVDADGKSRVEGRPRDAIQGTWAVLEPGEKLHTLGVDVARGGEDRSVIALRQGNYITELRRLPFSDDTMGLAGIVTGLQRGHGEPRAIIDAIGIGAGVFDRVREQGLPCSAFIASAGTKRTDLTSEFGFSNVRSWAWWNCFAGDTQILTREGRVALKDVAGTTVEVLTTGRHRSPQWMAAPVRSFGTQRVLRVEMSRWGVRQVIRATADHVWFVETRHGKTRRRVWTETSTSGLRPGDALAMCYPPNDLGRVSPSPFGIAHGFTFGDGTRRRAGSEAFFAQGKDEPLLPYFAHHKVTTVAGGYRVLGLPGFFKSLPPLGESRSYLLGWLAGYFAADGTVDTKGAVRLSSVRKSHLEFVRTLCDRLGLETTPVTKHLMKTGYSFGGTAYELCISARGIPLEFFVIPKHRERVREPVRSSSPWRIVSVEDDGDAEEVFCAVVPDTERFTLAEYILVHNCREMLDPSNGCDVALPPDDRLTGDLVAPKWKVMSGGRIQVESKDDIRKRIGRSTDDGDAVIQALSESGGSWADLYRSDEELAERAALEVDVPKPKQKPTRSGGWGDVYRPRDEDGEVARNARPLPTPTGPPSPLVSLADEREQRRPCTCGDPRSSHPEDGPCTGEGCGCGGFTART